MNYSMFVFFVLMLLSFNNQLSVAVPGISAGKTTLTLLGDASRLSGGDRETPQKPVEGILRQSEQQWITFEPEREFSNGRHIVLISGDDEYRSEEALPMLAKILTTHHGFKTTVLFPIDPETGEIKPDHQTNIPGMENLESADLMVLFTRFRELPDEQMVHFDNYLKAGKPIVALRTSTHAFNYERNPDSPFAHYHFRSNKKGWEGGFGRKILGETWINHHGEHGSEGTRGLIDGIRQRENHPVLRGVENIWGPTDVYGVTRFDKEVDVLVWGQSTWGMTQDSPVNLDKSIMPVAWTTHYQGEEDQTGRVFTTTMGSSVDLVNEGLRRLLVNACYWALGMENELPQRSNVSLVDEYNPTMFGFGTYRTGLFPQDYQ